MISLSLFLIWKIGLICGCRYLDDDDQEKSNRELIKWGSSKLEDKGFVYKYDTDMILDGSITFARTMGDLP